MLLILMTLVIIGLTYLVGLAAQKEKSPLWLSSSFFISFGTGLLLALAFLEFLPHALSLPHSGSLLSMLVGVLAVVFSERYIAPKLFPTKQTCDFHSHHHDSHHSHNDKDKIVGLSHTAACTSVGCIAICSYFDGIELSAAFQLSSEVGGWLSLGLIFHILPEGAMAAGLSKMGGFSKKGIHRSLLVICLFLLLGVLSGYSLSQVLILKGPVLSFVTGALLYICIGHLFPVAFRSPKGFWYVCLGVILIVIFHVISVGLGEEAHFQAPYHHGQSGPNH